MRALIVTNMWPTASEPALGSFVRDQVDALRELDGVEVEVFAFPPGGYLRAARALRRLHRRERFDVIHAHFGLTAWPALALRGAPHVVTFHGTDLRHPRSRRITRAALPFVDLVAAFRGPRPAPPGPGGDPPGGGAVGGSRRGGRPRARAGGAGRGWAAPGRRPALGGRSRPFGADPARRGARAPEPRPRRAVPALPGRPGAGRQALRPRAAGGG